MTRPVLTSLTLVVALTPSVLAAAQPAADAPAALPSASPAAPPPPSDPALAPPDQPVPPPSRNEPTAEAPVNSAPAATAATPAASSAVPPLLAAGNLQSPEQVSTRNSAYSLPRNTWAFNVGALGIGGGDAFATLGVGYGFGARVQANINLAHASVGLLNLAAGWHFLDTRYVDLGARVGFWYGHGKWFWIARGLTKELVSKVDVLQLPIELTASAPLTRWLELDLGAHYAYASLLGSVSNGDSLFADAQIGARQFFVQPGARFFLSDATAFEVFAKLPAFTTVPTERRDISVPFKSTWSMEGGFRSRLARGLFGTIRLHYGSVSDVIYGSRLYPSFELEYRL